MMNHAKQEEKILEIMEGRGCCTAREIHQILAEYDYRILLTSTRRAITNLTSDGRLIEGEKRQGKFVRVKTWKLNTYQTELFV